MNTMKLIVHLFNVALLLNVGTAYAAPKEEAKSSETKAEPKKGKATKDTYPLYGEVVAVTTRTLTIKGGEGKEDRKFTINAETRIHNDGKDATADAIKVGKKVGGLVKKTAGDGNDVMVSINVGVEQEKKPAAKKSEESKSKKKAE